MASLSVSTCQVSLTFWGRGELKRVVKSFLYPMLEEYKGIFQRGWMVVLVLHWGSRSLLAARFCHISQAYFFSLTARMLHNNHSQNLSGFQNKLIFLSSWICGLAGKIQAAGLSLGLLIASSFWNQNSLEQFVLMANSKQKDNRESRNMHLIPLKTNHLEPVHCYFYTHSVG